MSMVSPQQGRRQVQKLQVRLERVHCGVSTLVRLVQLLEHYHTDCCQKKKHHLPSTSNDDTTTSDGARGKVTLTLQDCTLDRVSCKLLPYLLYGIPGVQEITLQGLELVLSSTSSSRYRQDQEEEEEIVLASLCRQLFPTKTLETKIYFGNAASADTLTSMKAAVHGYNFARTRKNCGVKKVTLQISHQYPDLWYMLAEKGLAFHPCLRELDIVVTATTTTNSRFQLQQSAVCLHSMLQVLSTIGMGSMGNQHWLGRHKKSPLRVLKINSNALFFHHQFANNNNHDLLTEYLLSSQCHLSKICLRGPSLSSFSLKDVATSSMTMAFSQFLFHLSGNKSLKSLEFLFEKPSDLNDMLLSSLGGALPRLPSQLKELIFGLDDHGMDGANDNTKDVCDNIGDKDCTTAIDKRRQIISTPPPPLTAKTKAKLIRGLEENTTLRQIVLPHLPECSFYAMRNHVRHLLKQMMTGSNHDSPTPIDCCPLKRKQDDTNTTACTATTTTTAKAKNERQSWEQAQQLYLAWYEDATQTFLLSTPPPDAAMGGCGTPPKACVAFPYESWNVFAASFLFSSLSRQPHLITTSSSTTLS